MARSSRSAARPSIAPTRMTSAHDGRSRMSTSVSNALAGVFARARARPRPRRGSSRPRERMCFERLRRLGRAKAPERRARPRAAPWGAWSSTCVFRTRRTPRRGACCPSACAASARTPQNSGSFARVVAEGRDRGRVGPLAERRRGEQATARGGAPASCARSMSSGRLELDVGEHAQLGIDHDEARALGARERECLACAFSTRCVCRDALAFREDRRRTRTGTTKQRVRLCRSSASACTLHREHVAARARASPRARDGRAGTPTARRTARGYAR